MANDIYVHPRALNESEDVGEGTRIWAFAHVMSRARIGRNCNIGDHAFLESGAAVGDGVTIKNGVSIWDGVILENYVFIGPNAVFTNDKFPRSPRGPFMEEKYADSGWLEKTIVKEGATVGANATIVCGITIGKYSLIAAGSTVTSNVPDFGLVVGSPAKLRGYVCICGHPLPDSEKAACSICAKKYQRSAKGIEFMPGQKV